MTFVYRQRSRTDLFMLGFYHKRNHQRFFSATSWQTGLIPCALHTCEQVFTHLTYIGFPENETVELRKWVDDVQLYVCRGPSTPTEECITYVKIRLFAPLNDCNFPVKLLRNKTPTGPVSSGPRLS